MQYAMNMHQTPNYPPQSAARLSYPSQNYRDQPLQASYANYSSTPFTSQSQMQTPYQSYPPATSQPPSNNFMPNNMQWDPEMLSRYAEYQLQQNHQRQQRILLERQRHQLAELGIPVDDSGLLDQLFAGGSAPAPQASSSSHSHQQSQGTPQGEDMDQAGFIWPTATARSATAANQHGSRPTVPGISPAPGMLDHLYNMGRDGAVKEGDDTGFAWPTGGTVPGAEGFLPSPDSAEALGKKRGGSPFYGGSDDKRSRVY
jgi:MADS-box transcription factor